MVSATAEHILLQMETTHSTSGCRHKDKGQLQEAGTGIALLHMKTSTAANLMC